MNLAKDVCADARLFPFSVFWLSIHCSVNFSSKSDFLKIDSS